MPVRNPFKIEFWDGWEQGVRQADHEMIRLVHLDNYRDK